MAFASFDGAGWLGESAIQVKKRGEMLAPLPTLTDNQGNLLRSRAEES
jgi:hypothetical protein